MTRNRQPVDIIRHAHKRRIADVGRDAECTPPEDARVFAAFGEELRDDCHVFLTSFAGFGITRVDYGAKASYSSASFHVREDGTAVGFTTDALWARTGVGGVV
jgi:hypothetical protein